MYRNVFGSSHVYCHYYPSQFVFVYKCTRYAIRKWNKVAPTHGHLCIGQFLRIFKVSQSQWNIEHSINWHEGRCSCTEMFVTVFAKNCMNEFGAISVFPFISISFGCCWFGWPFAANIFHFISTHTHTHTPLLWKMNSCSMVVLVFRVCARKLSSMYEYY